MKISDFSYESVPGGYKINEYVGPERNIVIPEGVVEIGKDAFYAADITSVSFPMSLVDIGDSAFYDCVALKKISFAKNGSLRNIGEFAFAFCEALPTVELPRGLIFVGMNSFFSCCNLESASIYADCEMLKAETFLDCDALKTITVIGADSAPDRWHKKWNESRAEVVFIEDKNRPYIPGEGSGTYPTTMINEAPVSVPVDEKILREPMSTANTAPHEATDTAECKGDNKSCDKPGIDIGQPRSVTLMGEVGKYIATGCDDEAISTLKLPSGVVEIADNVFLSRGALCSVELPKSLIKIGACAFKNCTQLTKAKFSDTAVVGDYAFENTALKKIKLTKGMRRGCFANCKMLKTVEIDSGVTAVAEEMLLNTAVTAVDLGAIEAIMDSAFEGCKDLTRVDFSDNLGILGARAFMGCTLIEEVKIPSRLNTVGESAFKDCVSLSALDLSSVRVISASAFAGCNSLTEVVIPATVVRMGDNAFSDVPLTRVYVKGRGKDEFFNVFGYGWLGKSTPAREIELVFTDGTYIYKG